MNKQELIDKLAEIKKTNPALSRFMRKNRTLRIKSLEQQLKKAL